MGLLTSLIISAKIHIMIGSYDLQCNLVTQAEVIY